MTLRNVLPRRKAVRRARRSGDANVALIMFVMMTLVFGPVVGLHVFAAFGLQPPPASIVSRGVDATPPG